MSDRNLRSEGYLIPRRHFRDLPVVKGLFIEQVLVVDGQCLGRCKDAADLRVEFFVIVADALDHFARGTRKIHLNLGAKTCGDKDDGTRYGTFGPHTGIRVLLEKKVDDRIADLVAKFVRVPLGYGFGGKNKILQHRSSRVGSRIHSPPYRMALPIQSLPI